MERNKRTFDFEEVQPENVLQSAVDAIRNRFEAGGFAFDVKIQTGMPSIMADPDAVTTILLNLLDNAYKYSDANKRVNLRAYFASGNICFEVKDCGIGLSNRDTKRIFERFYQVDQSLSRRAGGCGLGLSIVKFLVDAHGGTITVESRQGAGSTFTVRIPVINSNKKENC